MSLSARLLLGTKPDSAVLERAFAEFDGRDASLGSYASFLRADVEGRSSATWDGLAGFPAETCLRFELRKERPTQAMAALARGVIDLLATWRSDACLVFHDEDVAFVCRDARVTIARWALEQLKSVPWDLLGEREVVDRIPVAWD